MEVPYTDQFIHTVAERCNFQNLKQNKLDASVIVDLHKDATSFRKGTWFFLFRTRKVNYQRDSRKGKRN